MNKLEYIGPHCNNSTGGVRKGGEKYLEFSLGCATRKPDIIVLITLDPRALVVSILYFRPVSKIGTLYHLSVAD